MLYNKTRRTREIQMISTTTTTKYNEIVLIIGQYNKR